MNYEQAKEVLNGDFTQVVLKDNESHSDVFSEAFHMAIEALEKQIPKKPDTECVGYWMGELLYDTWNCPCCGEQYEFEFEFENHKYCPECGQAIDWSE